MEQSASKRFPKEAREEVDRLIDYIKRRLDSGADERMLSAAATAVAKAFAEKCNREPMN